MKGLNDRTKNLKIEREALKLFEKVIVALIFTLAKQSVIVRTLFFFQPRSQIVLRLSRKHCFPLKASEFLLQRVFCCTCTAD